MLPTMHSRRHCNRPCIALRGPGTACGHCGVNAVGRESALLATEALQRLQSIDERSMEVDLSVCRALALLPQRLGGWLAITDRAQTGLAEAGAFRLGSRAMAADVLRQQGAEALAFGPDGRTRLASHGLWRLPVAGEAAAVRLLAWPRPPFAHAYSRDGRRLATRVAYDGEVTVWSLDTHQAAPTTAPPAGKLRAVSDDGRFLALQGAGGTRLWDIQQGAERVRLPFEGLAAAFGERGLTLLATNPDSPQTGRALVLGLQPAGAALASVDGAPRSNSSQPSASRTKSSRSWPKNIALPTKQVGAPKTPRATASSVLATRRALTSGSATSALKPSAVSPRRAGSGASRAAISALSPRLRGFTHIAWNTAST